MSQTVRASVFLSPSSLARLLTGALAVNVLLLASVMAGCQDGRGAINADSGDDDVVASRVALSLPVGADIRAVNYQVLSAAGVSLAAGTIGLEDQNATLSLDLVLGPGVGDRVALAAQTSAGASCAGTSAPFDVVPGRATFVGLTLVCGGDQPSSSHCPALGSWSVAPIEAATPFGAIQVGATVDASAAGDPLSYLWFATAGAFADPTAPATQYFCTTAGPQTLSLVVRDDASAPACTVSASFLVGCVAGTDGGSAPPSAVSAPAPN
jgi:hypothetical protein